MNKNIKNDIKDITQYITLVFNKTPLFDWSFFSQLHCIKEKELQYVIVSRNPLLRYLSAKAGVLSYAYSDILSISKRMLAFRDGLILLSQNNIPVYFFNRVDEKPGFPYSQSASKRIRSNQSFPTMCQNISEYNESFSELMGEYFSEEYVANLSHIPQVIKLRDRYCHEDYISSCINVLNGMRIVPDQPHSFSRTLHMYGRCGVFGYAVEDKETLPNHLQKQLISLGYHNIRVVNHGLWGGDDTMIDHNFLCDIQDFSSGDIVLFYRLRFDSCTMNFLIDNGIQYFDPTNQWHNYSESSWCFYDRPGHMNHIGYKNLAEIMANELIKTDFMAPQIHTQMSETHHLNAYVESVIDKKLDKEIDKYIDSIKKLTPKTPNGNNGAIVMNCNPFTKGHRFLVEYASKRVDWLYVFVVEENKSFFDFNDRYQMVIDGLSDLNNVTIIPSGRFMISAYTFPEYFMKEYVNHKNVSVSTDIRIFATKIAPSLSIQKRFVGEEPFDNVTRMYNEAMKKYFPRFKIELIEIPRKTLNDSRIINATEVRKLLKSGEKEKILEYVPYTTYKIIENKYLSK